jgi:hypothetical protein
MKDSTHEIQLLQHMEQTSAMLEAIGDQVGDDEHGVPLLSRHRSLSVPPEACCEALRHRISALDEVLDEAEFVSKGIEHDSPLQIRFR